MNRNFIALGLLIAASIASYARGDVPFLPLLSLVEARVAVGHLPANDVGGVGNHEAKVAAETGAALAIASYQNAAGISWGAGTKVSVNTAFTLNEHDSVYVLAKAQSQSSFTLTRPQILVLDYEVHTRTFEGLEAEASVGISGSNYAIGVSRSTKSSFNSDETNRLVWIAEPGDYRFSGAALSHFYSGFHLSLLSHRALASIEASFQIYPTIERIDVGDSNSDGNVDGSDFLSWQREFGQALGPSATADENDDGVIDAADLNIWAEVYARPLPTPEILAAAYPGSTLLIPEPTSGCLFLFGLVGMMQARSAQRRNSVKLLNSI